MKVPVQGMHRMKKQTPSSTVAAQSSVQQPENPMTKKSEAKQPENHPTKQPENPSAKKPEKPAANKPKTPPVNKPEKPPAKQPEKEQSANNAKRPARKLPERPPDDPHCWDELLAKIMQHPNRDKYMYEGAAIGYNYMVDPYINGTPRNYNPDTDPHRLLDIARKSNAPVPPKQPVSKPGNNNNPDKSKQEAGSRSTSQERKKKVRITLNVTKMASKMKLFSNYKLFNNWF